MGCDDERSLAEGGARDGVDGLDMHRGAPGSVALWPSPRDVEPEALAVRLRSALAAAGVVDASPPPTSQSPSQTGAA